MSTPVGIEGSQFGSLRIVNVVSSGSLGIGEVNTEKLGEDVSAIKTVLPGRVYIKKDEDAPIVMIFKSGVFSIAGASSWGETLTAIGWLEDILSELGLDVSEDSLREEISVKYLVVTGDFETALDLGTISISLGMESTEYEPEQFPAVIYRPREVDCTVLLFSTGKITITGVRNIDDAKKVYEDVREQITNLL